MDTSAAKATDACGAAYMDTSSTAAMCSAASAATAMTATSAATAMAASAATAAAMCRQSQVLGERGLSAVFPVEGVECRQAGVEDFLLTDKDFMRL
jgi:hypothetical protein